MMFRSTAVACLVIGVAVVAAAQVMVPPRPVDVVEPVYPEAARAHAIDGTAEFRATVNPDGTVASVSVLSVPRPGLGFEQAVEQAVRSWRFAAGTLDGAPVVGSYVGRMRFVLPSVLPGEMIYPVRSRDAWRAVQRVMGDLRFASHKEDDVNQLFVTKWANYTRAMPSADALGLSGARPSRLQLHVYVAPHMEPARVAFGSFVDAEPIGATRQSIVEGLRTGVSMFSPDAITKWFHAKLSMQLKATPEPLKADPEGRAEQAARLMPRGLIERCAIQPSQRIALESATRTPKVIFDTKPEFPAGRRPDGLVWITADVTEHGTVTRPTIEKISGGYSGLETASLRAAFLWRFTPALAGECAAIATVTMEFSFKTMK